MTSLALAATGSKQPPGRVGRGLVSSGGESTGLKSGSWTVRL